jgi:Fe-S oxidoreductase
MPERPEFWGIPQPWSWVVYSILFLSGIYMIVRFTMQATQWWRVGRPEPHYDHLFTRLVRLAKYYVVQTKVLSEPYAGIMHVAIAWSFFIFFLGTAMGTIHGHFVRFLQGNTFLAYKIVLDLTVLIYLVGAGMAFYRRFITRPDRLTMGFRFGQTLLLLTGIVLIGPFIESFRLAIERPDWAAWSPLGWGLAQLWIASGASESILHGWHIGFYSLHVGLVALAFVTLPTSTLLHVGTSALNIFFSKLDHPLAKLPAVAQNQAGEWLYANRLQHLTWKQLLDADACTECGRCQDACPAYASGRPLSPKQLVLSLREAYHAGPAYQDKALVGSWISGDTLWSCTTCGACVQECPVLIDQLRLVVDMRRYLVSESRMDAGIQDTLANYGRYGNAFGQSERARVRWAQTLPDKIKDARKEAVDYLWFVGDYASYNPVVAETTRKAAAVFQKAGIDFGLLYEGERNAGNDARRIGEEGLFEMLVEKNKAALEKATFNKIVTTDPHAFNTLKNEYPSEIIAGRPVLHYTELLDELLRTGKLKLTRKLAYQVTYHDPCYLGRYNGIYDAPRRIIAATGCTLVEMPRNRARSYCCGAGGGLIWMQDVPVVERPSENRIREAIALPGVDRFVVACPKDLTMYQDAIKTTANEARIQAVDLIELVYEAL